MKNDNFDTRKYYKPMNSNPRVSVLDGILNKVQFFSKINSCSNEFLSKQTNSSDFADAI